MPPEERLPAHLNLLYDLLALIDLLPSTTIPVATSRSQTLLRFAPFFSSPTQNGSSPLAWSILRPLLEQCFGAGLDVDPARIEAGPMGFGLVGLALRKLGQVEDEREQLEMRVWLTKLKEACVQQM